MAGPPDLRTILTPRPGANRVPPGDYTSSVPILLPGDSELVLDRARIVRTGDTPVFVAGPGTSNVSISGVAEFGGSGIARPIVRATQSRNLRIELDLLLGNCREPFLLSQASDGVYLGGSLRTADSPLVRATDSSGVEVTGVHAAYSTDPGQPTVRVASTGTRGVVQRISVHDCVIDGGGVFDAAGGPIVISADIGTTPIQNVQLHDVEVVRTKRPRDGIDVGRCQNVRIANVFGREVNDAVSLMSSDVEVTSVVAVDCFAQSVAIGDPQFLTTNESGCAVRSSCGVSCGRGYTNPASSGFAVQTPPGFVIQGVRFERCVSTSGGTAYPLFGFAASAGSRNVVLEDCRFEGSRSATLVQCPPEELRSSASGAPLPSVSDWPLSSANFDYRPVSPETIFLVSDRDPANEYALSRGGAAVPPTALGRRWDLLPGDVWTARIGGAAPRLLRWIP